MGKIRQSKYKRGETPVAFRMTDGDFQLLKFVHAFRYITTPMLVQLTGRAPQKINQRTRFLYDAGYLERIHLPHPKTGGGSRESIHILDDPGIDLLAEYFKTPRKAIGTSPKNNKNPDLILRHKLLISHIQAVFLSSIQQIPWIELLFWHRESDQFKETVYVDGEELRVYPDAFFGVKDSRQPEGKQRYFFFVEADRDTMDYADMRRKYAAYYHFWKKYQHDGSPVFNQVKNFRVLTVVEPESDQRLPGLFQVAHEATPQGHGSALFWFTSHEQLPLDVENPFLAQVWNVAKAGNPELFPLLKDKQ